MHGSVPGQATLRPRQPSLRREHRLPKHPRRHPPWTGSRRLTNRRLKLRCPGRSNHRSLSPNLRPTTGSHQPRRRLARQRPTRRPLPSLPDWTVGFLRPQQHPSPGPPHPSPSPQSPLQPQVTNLRPWTAGSPLQLLHLPHDRRLRAKKRQLAAPRGLKTPSPIASRWSPLQKSPHRFSISTISTDSLPAKNR